MVRLDSNVLRDISTKDPRWFARSGEHLEPLINAGEAAINPIIYAELAPAYSTAIDLVLLFVGPLSPRMRGGSALSGERKRRSFTR